MQHKGLAVLSILLLANVSFAHDSQGLQHPVAPIAAHASSSASQQQNQSQSSSSHSRSRSSSQSSARNSQNMESNNPRQTSSAASVNIAPTAVCSGTSGGGLQGGTVGLSFGTSWTDNNCILLEQVRTTAELGHGNVAAEMMCSVPNYREAREALGIPCRRRAKVVPTTNSYDTWDHNDPIIRSRMGLPPQ